LYGIDIRNNNKELKKRKEVKSEGINWRRKNGERRRNPMYERKRREEREVETPTHGSLRNPKHIKYSKFGTQHQHNTTLLTCHFFSLLKDSFSSIQQYLHL